jgi:1-acyl-sn-glycerol-3-phosphate acyltransferase
MTVQAQVRDGLERAAEFVETCIQQLEVTRPGEELAYWYGRSAMDIYTRLALQLDVEWHARLPRGPKIIAANHPTTTDPFYVLALIPEQTSILITDMAFAVPGFGKYLRAAGHVPVAQDKGRLACSKARQLLESGRTICIFPEGALSPLGKEPSLHQPRTGAVRLALSCGAPIVPLGISLRPERIRFSTAQAGGRAEVARWYLSGPYAVTVGEAMHCHGDVEDWAHVRALSRQVMRRIAWLSRASAQRLDRFPREIATFDALPPGATKSVLARM